MYHLRRVCHLYGWGRGRKEKKNMCLRPCCTRDATLYSPGPKMTAFHSIMLSGHGLPEIPPGGSVERRLKSRMRRLLQLVD